ncbi:class I SAM-dependent RNA methyltransferase [uncultured Aquimarina sp.]|uniref:THUMP domain-containing class I SAM-dependent RNA methyltransferase n=1 Tax=uncultured Aquimarina sp. TaxID=575652 RepID=UPI00260BD065|nr:class I SAM-dependent RNA methyltransferase [uncultured Aquimarina sp.]
MSNSFKMVAKTFFGFEEILAKELRNLGAQKVQIGNRMVSFYGDIGFMYKANLCLRTALKILKPISSKKIRNEKDLYGFIQSIRWDEYLNTEDTFAIYATVNSTIFTHSQFISLKSKDAIVDKFRNETGKRPNVDTDYPDLTINIHIQEDLCTVSLDSSGGSLHHRGYRSATNIAPINEVLAAGLLLLSGWDGQCDFLDPMCGSGTFAIEAAMIACNIPANLNRKEFAFEKWLDWDMDLFEKIEEASLKKTRDFHLSIIGFDKAPSAVRKAKQNVENANLTDFVTIKDDNFFESVKDDDKKLHMVFNPPYGERLELDEEKFYAQIGDTLKQSYPNTNAWFITSNLEALKFVGLRPSRKIKVFNGKLECRLAKYEMYAGSKKAKFQDKS